MEDITTARDRAQDTAVRLIVPFHNRIIRDLMMVDIVTNTLPEDFREIRPIILGQGISPD